MTGYHPRPILVALPLRAAMEIPDTMAASIAAGTSVVMLVEPADWVEHSDFLEAWCSASPYREPNGAWRVSLRRMVARGAHWPRQALPGLTHRQAQSRGARNRSGFGRIGQDQGS